MPRKKKLAVRVASCPPIRTYIYMYKINQQFVDKNCSNNLLILNIFEEEDELLWNKLYDFLNLKPEDDIVDTEFPKINLNQ